MERVLIVAKTRMKNGLCVSGLTASNKNVRLKSSDRFNQPEDTPFEIGQVWDVAFKPVPHVELPHTEDVIVSYQRPVCTLDPGDLRDTLLSRVHPWRGGPENLFDQALVIDRGKCYINRSRPLPTQSTGFWLPDRPLNIFFEYGKTYYQTTYTPAAGRLSRLYKASLKFVGLAPPLPVLPAGTLLRVSLARWFFIEGEERCYLQLSGWFL